MKHVLILLISLAVLATGGIILRTPPLWAASHHAGPYHWSETGVGTSRPLHVPPDGVPVHYRWDCAQRGTISIQDTAYDSEGEHMWDEVARTIAPRGTFILRAPYPVHTAWLATFYVIPGARSCRLQIAIPAYDWT
jgi:hypothetical protein